MTDARSVICDLSSVHALAVGPASSRPPEGWSRPNLATFRCFRRLPPALRAHFVPEVAPRHHQFLAGPFGARRGASYGCPAGPSKAGGPARRARTVRHRSRLRRPFRCRGRRTVPCHAQGCKSMPPTRIVPVIGRPPETTVPDLDALLITSGPMLCRLRVWTDAEWRRLPAAERPAQHIHAPGLGWVGAVPIVGLN